VAETTHPVESAVDEKARDGMSSTIRVDQSRREYRAARSPRSAGISGILFAILFSVSATILYLSASGEGESTAMWLATRVVWIRLAIGLVPFAGICFLWFIGVVRARLGQFEDQFFSTVFLGSGLLLLAMIFVATGVAGALVAGYQRDPAGFIGSPTYHLARDIITQTFGIYALRMAAVFLMSQGTLWVRTKVMPRWLAYVTYAVSLVLLFVYRESYWVVLLFPAWTLLVSTYVLIGSMVLNRRREDRGLVDAL